MTFDFDINDNPSIVVDVIKDIGKDDLLVFYFNPDRCDDICEVGTWFENAVKELNHNAILLPVCFGLGCLDKEEVLKWMDKAKEIIEEYYE